MRVGTWAALGALAACLAGCDSVKTVSYDGGVGQTLKAPGGLQVQPVRYLPRVPAPARDVTGLATPAAGTHFAAFLIRMCVNTTGLPTIAPQNFTLALAGGADAVLKFPETVFADDLNLLGAAGCERGHIVFDVPTGGRPSALRFKLDVDTGNVNGHGNRTKVRFTWKL
jgi:hypothetical protein